MTQEGELFCIQVALRERELDEVARSFERAYEEDLRENADMFDIKRLTFSQNLHKNATMRALEDELAQKDLAFLQLLGALLAIGRDLVLGLADLTDRAELLSALSAELAAISARGAEPCLLAQEITTVKAEHQRKRLCAVMDRLQSTRE